jgi:hypothetical protein
MTTNESLSWRFCSSLERGGGMPVMPKTKMTAVLGQVVAAEENNSIRTCTANTNPSTTETNLNSIGQRWAYHTAYSFPLHPPTVLAIEMLLETLYWLIHGLIPFAKSVASAKCFLHILRGN